jgi:hypothetical protein
VKDNEEEEDDENWGKKQTSVKGATTIKIDQNDK